MKDGAVGFVRGNAGRGTGTGEEESDELPVFFIVDTGKIG
jgi:hypothetical protein